MAEWQNRYILIVWPVVRTSTSVARKNPGHNPHFVDTILRARARAWAGAAGNPGVVTRMTPCSCRMPLGPLSQPFEEENIDTPPRVSVTLKTRIGPRRLLIRPRLFTISQVHNPSTVLQDVHITGSNCNTCTVCDDVTIVVLSLVAR